MCISIAGSSKGSQHIGQDIDTAVSYHTASVTPAFHSISTVSIICEVVAELTVNSHVIGWPSTVGSSVKGSAKVDNTTTLGQQDGMRSARIPFERVGPAEDVHRRQMVDNAQNLVPSSSSVLDGKLFTQLVKDPSILAST